MTLDLVTSATWEPSIYRQLIAVVGLIETVLKHYPYWLGWAGHHNGETSHVDI